MNMRQDKYHDTQSVTRTDAVLGKTEAHSSKEEVIFPAFETISPAKSGAPVEKPVSPRKRRLLLAALLVLVAIGITAFIYLRNRPRPVPTPTSVDLPTYTTSTAGEIPPTAFRITPEKQQLIGVQYGTVEYQTISKSLRAVGKVAYDETSHNSRRLRADCTKDSEKLTASLNGLSPICRLPLIASRYSCCVWTRSGL